MDVLSSRILLRPADLERTRTFYGETLGLGVYREFSVGTVYFLGSGFLEVSVGDGGTIGPDTALWLQVRDVAAEYERLVGLGVTALRAPQIEPWGLFEARVADPDGLQIFLVEIPADHPLRSDQRV